MKVENVYQEFHIDYQNKRVHILEKGQPVHSNSLPNVIGKTFKKKFIEKEKLLIDILDFEYVCYCSNGLVLLFKENGLHLTNKTEEQFYKPFLDALK